ncbi:MAG TPA: hypothetical protein VF468_23810 [Actinomycetota bacterium]|nr:hypothetical protein [Actinomycetota bacterium]
MISTVPDAIFVVAGYGVILGAIALYAVTLVRRLRRAERAAGGPEEPAPPDR